jgi:hypothetical protein
MSSFEVPAWQKSERLTDGVSWSVLIVTDSK